MCLCFAILFVGVVGGMIFYAYRSVKAVNRAWGDLGMRTGLTLKPAAMFSQPELNGEYRQRPIRVYTENSVGQGNRTTWTVVGLTVNNPNNSTLEITPSGTVGNFLGKMINAQDVEIGNPEFDARFVFKSNPPDFAVKVLADSPVQTDIMDIPGTFRIHLEGSSLKYSKTNLEENADFLAKLFNTLSDMADRLEGN
jgi:hypothetical protein